MDISITLGILGLLFNGILLVEVLYIIWDHFKDDRLLTEKVQEFYEDIEKLIFYFYRSKIIEDLKKAYENPPIPRFADGGKPISLSIPVDKTKGTFLDEIKEINECSNQYIYTKIKIQQNFDKYSNYLSLISDKSLIPDKIESEKKEELRIKNAYFNDTYIILYDTGLLKRRQGEIILRKIIEDYSDIKEDEINEINDYLKGLQVYWKNRYHKFLLKPNLKKRKDFNEDVMKFIENLKKDFKDKSKEDYSKREYLAHYSGKYEEAIELNDKILELDPKDKKAWLNSEYNKLMKVKNLFLNGNKKLIRGDALNTRFINNRFDFCCIFEAFIMFDAYNLGKKLLKEIIRIVKPGGYILIVEIRQPENFFDFPATIRHAREILTKNNCKIFAQAKSNFSLHFPFNFMDIKSSLTNSKYPISPWLIAQKEEE